MVYSRYKVYRGYIVFAFSVIMFVCLSVCLSVCWPVNFFYVKDVTDFSVSIGAKCFQIQCTPSSRLSVLCK